MTVERLAELIRDRDPAACDDLAILKIEGGAGETLAALVSELG